VAVVTAEGTLLLEFEMRFGETGVAVRIAEAIADARGVDVTAGAEAG
jgi:hypothetical protein